MAGLKVPVLIAVGDADAVRTAHAVEFFELLGGGKKTAALTASAKPPRETAILPDVTHYDIVDKPALVAAATAFLDAAPPKPGNPGKTEP